MSTSFPTTADKAAFSTLNITKVYGEENVAVHALRGVTVEIPAGEIVVLLGPSGAENPHC